MRGSRERVHAVAPAVLVEERVSGGERHLVPVLSGRATVTDRRVVFEGDRQREWLFSRVTEIRDLRPETVLLTVTNRKQTSGLRFTADAERLRLLVTLALADFQGSRTDVVAQWGNLLSAHHNRRPVPPGAPPEPPVPPVDAVQEPVTGSRTCTPI
jgi:hypothetical protein